MYTVGRLAKQFSLSRSTLLYYDRIGLLKPDGRTEGNYRRYTQADAKRLERICLYRRTGLKLDDIKGVLDSPQSGLKEVLEKRLVDLNADIGRLRDQQRLIVGLLGSRSMEKHIGVMNRETWVALLTSAGFSQEDMIKWHADFERISPDKHAEFLKFLCVPDDEIEIIRGWARRHPD